MKPMNLRRYVAMTAVAAGVLTAAMPVLAEPQWQMHRTLLDSPMLDAAFPDENTVLVANQNGLVTLNTDAEVLKRQGIDSTVSYPILAENGSYAVVHHRRRVPQFSESITLYSVSGETGAMFPISGSPYLAPNGDWLLTVDKYNNRVSIYNARGDKLREDTYPEIRDYGMKFSSDGRHVALNLPQNGVDAIAVVYDNIGRLQTKVRHILGQAQPGLTPNGDTLVIIARVAVTIYDETGTEQQRIQRGRNAGVGILTRDGEELWLAENGRDVYLCSLQNILKYKEISYEGNICDIADVDGGYVKIGWYNAYSENRATHNCDFVDRIQENVVARYQNQDVDNIVIASRKVIVMGIEEVKVLKRYE